MTQKKFKFKCPHCGYGVIMNRRMIRISSCVRYVTQGVGGAIDPEDTDDTEDEIDMSEQTSIDVCCAKCGHYWDNFHDAFDKGAFVEETSEY